MWQRLLERSGRPKIEHVTNGVHLPTWIGPELGEVLERHLGRDFPERAHEAGFEEAIGAIPDHEIWAAHSAQKRRLVGLVRQRALQQFARHGRSPDELRLVDELLDARVLTIGFARRFATYKRADLILRDADRLRALLLHAERPVQFIFAGKAHPADRPGQDLIRRISQFATAPDVQGRLIFVENYDMRIARGLVQGVDVWLNSPRRPQEASGTSGMKAAMNGVLNCSILDGWWCEAYQPDHGWAIGDDRDHGDQNSQDQQDADALYRLLADEIAPMFYGHNEQGLPVAWIRRMKIAMGRLTPRFSSGRMLREYTERFYLTAARGELAVAAARSVPAVETSSP
jgi:starch phosphorylase